MENEIVYTVAEASLRLKKSESWIYRAARAGVITVARVGNSIRITRAEIVRLLKPANADAVATRVRQELLKRERRHDQAIMKEIDERYSVKNMKRNPAGTQ